MTLPRRTPLAQGKPLERKTALKAKTPLKPGKPLARSTGLSRTSPPPAPRVPLEDAPRPTRSPGKPRRSTGPTRDVTDLVRARDGDLCVCCGQPGTDWDPLVIHHRADLGMGGSKAPTAHRLSRLLLVHASENGAFEDAGRDELTHFRAMGWKLRRTDDPLIVPVWYERDGSLWLLDDDGGRHSARDVMRVDNGRNDV